MILSLKMKFGQKFWSWALVKILKLKPLNLIFWFGHSRCPKRKSKTTFFRPNIPPISGENGLRNQFWPLYGGFLTPVLSFSQNPLMARFWNFGFLKYSVTCIQKCEISPWNIFQVWMQVPATCVMNATFPAKVLVISSNIC